MKFLCSNCKAKYQIPDEKIAGRTLKMDCRRCNTPITIRGDQPQPDDAELGAEEPEAQRPRAGAPASSSAASRTRPGAPVASRPAGASSTGSSVGQHPAGAGINPRATGRSALGADFRRNVGAGGGLAAAAEAPRLTPLDQWHVAINDVPVGPMKRDEIARKIAAGAANADSLAWREGFDDWRPIREIPELAALLRRTAVESDRPGARPGAPRAPAPRAPAPRPGAAPPPGARSPLGAPAAARASTGRNNVVPIGGRHGASAASSYDLEDGDDAASEGETTTIASAADLGLGDFGKPERDDGEIPGPVGRAEVKPNSARAEELKRDAKVGARGPAAGFKPIPAPGAKIAPAAKPAAPAARPAPAAPVAPPKAAPSPLAIPEDDPFGLPPAEPELDDRPGSAGHSGGPKRSSFVPPPADLAPAVPIARPVSSPPVREERRGPAIGIGAMMGIGFAMAAGAVLMYAVVQRFVLSPPPPTTSVVATVATIAPTPSELQHEAPIDDTTPPPTTALAAPATDVPPASAVAPPTTGPHHPVTTTTTPPTTGARSATKTPAGDDPFAQFADDGAGPAPIATTATHHHDDATGPAHTTAELTSDQIGSVVRSGQRQLTTCWETALRAAGHVDGDVRYTVDITIGTSGRVTSVNARGPTVASLQDCLERGVRRWAFPPSGGETQTTFPLVFAAQQ